MSSTSELRSRTNSPLERSVRLVDRGRVADVALVPDQRDLRVWRLSASAEPSTEPLSTTITSQDRPSDVARQRGEASQDTLDGCSS